jgi:hypothetical protein
MNPIEPQFDPENNLDNFRSIIDRMARARWITGTNIATREQFWLSFSDLGRQRMKKASDALRRAAPQFFDAPDLSALKPEDVRQPSLLDLISVMVQVGPVIWELQPPPFSDGERDTMIRIILAYTREAAGRDIGIPPGRFQL